MFTGKGGATQPPLPALEKEGHTLFHAQDAEQAREITKNHQPGLCLLDLEASWCLETYLDLEKSGLTLPPALALVPRKRLSSYDPTPGVADFVVIPCPGEELSLRVKQLLRRQSPGEEKEVRQGDLVVNLAQYEVSLGGRPVYLTYTEYELLKFLALNPGKVFTREALLDRVWGYDYFGGTRTVDVHVRRLRSKIEDAGHSFIETVRNVGYRFKG